MCFFIITKKNPPCQWVGGREISWSGKAPTIFSIAGVDKQIKDETYEEAVEYIKGMTSYQSQQIDQLRYSNAVDKATVNEKVATIKAELSSILLNNELTKAKTDNTIQLTEESKNKILQEWQKLIIDTVRLDNEQKKVKIEEFKTNLSSEYQGVSNILGKMMNDFIGLTKTEQIKNYTIV